MTDILLEIWVKFWQEKRWRPHLLNAGLTIVIAMAAFFYVNSKHTEAMAEITRQQTLNEKIIERLQYISGRIDDLYRILASQ